MNGWRREYIIRAGVFWSGMKGQPPLPSVASTSARRANDLLQVLLGE
jgi:hypothetical protein